MFALKMNVKMSMFSVLVSLVHLVQCFDVVLVDGSDASSIASKNALLSMAPTTATQHDRVNRTDVFQHITNDNKNEKRAEAIEAQRAKAGIRYGSPDAFHQIMNSNRNEEKEEVIEAQRKANIRYVEAVAEGLNLDMDIYSILHSSTSEVQSIQVLDTFFGRTLVTDGKTQSAEHDEFVYHESLVHPAMFWSSYLARIQSTDEDKDVSPRTVFIGGGGELATAREVLKHNTIDRVVMVDLDKEVIEVCKKHLPEWGGETVQQHPKVEYVTGDVRHYLSSTNEMFDVIILDVSDPIEAGPAVQLYTHEFYQVVSKRLKMNGVFVTQSGSASYIPFPQVGAESTCFAPIRNTLATVFDNSVPYTCQIPSFGEDWGFVMAFNGDAFHARQLANLAIEEIDQMIEERIISLPGVPEHRNRSIGENRVLTGKERGKDVLKHYDGETHRGLFSLSKPLRELMKSDDRIMTEDNPIFMY